MLIYCTAVLPRYRIDLPTPCACPRIRSCTSRYRSQLCYCCCFCGCRYLSCAVDVLCRIYPSLILLARSCNAGNLYRLFRGITRLSHERPSSWLGWHCSILLVTIPPLILVGMSISIVWVRRGSGYCSVLYLSSVSSRLYRCFLVLCLELLRTGSAIPRNCLYFWLTLFSPCFRCLAWGYSLIQSRIPVNALLWFAGRRSWR